MNTLFYGAAAALPGLNSFLQTVQASQISLTTLTPALSQLQTSLGQPGALGMDAAQQAQVLLRLDTLREQASQYSDTSGLVSRTALQSSVEALMNSLPVRLSGRREAPVEMSRDYDYVEPLAGGGCSNTFIAYDHRTGEMVTIKVAEGGEGVMTQAFADCLVRQEFAFLKGLKEGTCPRPIRIGLWQGKACMVMEYLLGSVLHDLRSELLHELKTDTDLHWVMQVVYNSVAEVAALHGQDVVHCDVKPENFMSLGGSVRVFDFGIALFKGETHSYVSGTPNYLAPEGWNNANPAGFPRDVFALGVMLYEFLTGRAPFDAASPQEIGQNIVNPLFQPDPPADILFARADLALSETAVSLVMELDSIVMRALNHDPEMRFPNAGEMLDALKGAMSRFVPVPNPAAIPPRRQARPARKRRGSDREETRNDRVAPVRAIEETSG